MKNYFNRICLCAFIFCATAQAQNPTDPQLDRVIGKVFLILSKEYTVSGQGNDQPSLWANAKLGRVAYPTSKIQNSETRWETEMVPTESGIVLTFNPPFDPNRTQKHWTTAHDADAKQFEIVITLPDKRIIGIRGSYGSAFPKKYLDRLIALSKSSE